MALFAVIMVFLLTAGWFALYLVRRDRGEHEPIAALWTAFGFGALGIVFAGLLEYFWVSDIVDSAPSLMVLAWASLAISVIEETSKSLPLMLFLYKKRYFNEHTDGVIYFALAGLGFGLPENILYTLQYGPGTGLLRVVLTPLFHASTTALIGYAIARAKVGKMPKLRVLYMVVAAIGLHAAYDFGLFSQIPALALMSVILTVALGVGLFWLYVHSRRLDQELGLSVVGNNSYCRHCGQHNPKHYLYCSHCGKHA
jgi:RsiW-degrading membrane proteinase PrsW (M82 family)